jgi:hypothetical protein
MSRLWDTPEYWARTEADELLHDFPSTATVALARSLEQDPGRYEGDPDFTRDIVAELKKRAVAGVRFWPEIAELASIEHEVQSALMALPLSDDHDDRDERSVFWWKNI